MHDLMQLKLITNTQLLLILGFRQISLNRFHQCHSNRTKYEDGIS